jgi:cell division protein FtsQ
MKSHADENTSSSKRQRRFRSVVVNGIAVAGALGLFTLLGFIDRKRSSTPIHSLEIQIEGQSGKAFIDSSAIRSLVFKAFPGLIGTPAKEVNLHQIHSALIAHPTISQAQVYQTVDGRCMIKVKQREPIARILNSDGSGFYLDLDGFSMPLSRNFTAHVPVFNGRLSEKPTVLPVPVLTRDSIWSGQTHLDEIYHLTQFIRNNDFLIAQVEHVVFNDKGEMEIIPRVGNHRIVIGNDRDLDLKYRKLMTFYAQTLHSRDLNQYRKINLKYDNQVVCEKY